MSPMKVALFLAGVICAAHAQTAQVSTTTARPGFFSSFIRAPIEAIRGAFNSGINLKGSALNFSTNAANQLATGVIGAKQNLATMANGIASSGVQFGTQAVSNLAGIGASLVAPVPVVGTLANVGSRLVGAGAGMANAALQTGISTLNAAEMAKLNAIHGAVTMGTGMAQSVGNSVLEGKRAAVNAGFDMASNAAGMVDSAVTNALSTGVNMVSGLADQVVSTGNGIAANMQASLNGAITAGTNAAASAAGAVNAAATNAATAATNAATAATNAATAATNAAGAISAATNSGAARLNTAR